jgi:aspartate racemase
MAGSFYRERLAAYGIEVLTPSQSKQDTVHDIIYRELVQNRLCDESRHVFIDIIRGLAHQGAQGCILGCTEIPLLIKASDVEIPVFDTTMIHCELAVARAFDPASATGELN